MSEQELLLLIWLFGMVVPFLVWYFYLLYELTKLRVRRLIEAWAKLIEVSKDRQKVEG